MLSSSVVRDIRRHVCVGTGTTTVVPRHPLHYHHHHYCRAARYLSTTVLRINPEFTTAAGLLSFVQDNGGKIHEQISVVSSPTSGDFSVQAVERIETNAVLFCLPLRLCLSTTSNPTLVSSSSPGLSSAGGLYTPAYFHALEKIIAQVPDQLWQLQLGMRVLAERAHGDSFWQPYIDMLPQQYPGIPLFFSRTHHAALQYSPLRAEVSKRARFLGTIAQAINADADVQTHAFAGFDVPADSLGWGMSAVSSRAFFLGKKGRFCLPLVDMLNHSFAANAKVGVGSMSLPSTPPSPSSSPISSNFSRVSSSPLSPLNDSDKSSSSISSSGGDSSGHSSPTFDAIIVRAARDISAGEELTIDYGGGSSNNDHFLIDYGFVSMETNRHDDLQIGHNMSMFNMACQAALSASLPPSSASSSSSSFSPHSTPSPIAPAVLRWRDETMQLLSSGWVTPTTAYSVNWRLVDPRLMAILRVLVADEVDVNAHTLQLQQRSSSNNINNNNNNSLRTGDTTDVNLARSLEVLLKGNVTRENEARAVRAFRFILDVANKSFPTSLEQDEIELQQQAGVDDVNMKVCLHFRMGKKRLVQHWLTKTETIV